MSHSPTPTKDEAKAARRAKAAVARESSLRAERRRSWLIRGLVAVAVLALVGTITGILLATARPQVVALPEPPTATGTAMPPWAPPSDPNAGIRAAGLSISPMTSDGAHFHPHLDIRVDGKAVPVPANIGIDPSTGTMSELHTHDASGVVHIESPAKNDRYVLGQLFTEWGVRLDRTHLGGLTSRGDRTLVAYVDGKRFDGNPAWIELKAHRQIALLYGTASQQQDPPSSYNFPAGE